MFNELLSFIPDFKTKIKKCNSISSITTHKIDGVIVDCAKIKLLLIQKSENNEITSNELNSSVILKQELLNSNVSIIEKLEAEFNAFLKKGIKYNVSDEVIDEEFNKKETEKKNIIFQNLKLNNELKSIKKRIKSLHELSELTLNPKEFDSMSHFELKELLNKYIDRIELYKDGKWFFIKVIYGNSDEEFCFIRRSRSLQSDLYQNYQKTHLEASDYEFLLENNCFDNMENTYLMYHYSNEDKEFKYDKANKRFSTNNASYGIDDFIKYVTTRDNYIPEFYKYFYYNEN